MQEILLRIQATALTQARQVSREEASVVWSLELERAASEFVDGS